MFSKQNEILSYERGGFGNLRRSTEPIVKQGRRNRSIDNNSISKHPFINVIKTDKIDNKFFNNRGTTKSRMKGYDTVNLLSKIEQTKQNLKEVRIPEYNSSKEAYMNRQSCLAKNANHFIFDDSQERQKHSDLINLGVMK